MIIESLTVTEFGVFQKIEMTFCKDKVNIIRGGNGCGKTIILAILYSMLQDHEIMQYSCEGNVAIIKLELADQKNHICLIKSYGKNHSGILVESFDEMRKFLSINRDTIYLFSGEFINHKRRLNGEVIKNAHRLLDKMGIENEYKIDLSESNSRSYNLMSGGVQTYYWILNILYNMPQESVLLIDDPFAMLDTYTTDQLLNIMGKMKDIQFILTANLGLDVSEDYNQIYLYPQTSYIGKYGRVNFDYKRVFNDDSKVFGADQKAREAISDEKPIIKYELGKEIEEVEKRNVEFKEIKGNNPCNSIVDNAEIYINAFLNSKISGIGIIKWGISDRGIVKGVELSKTDRDTINRKLSERIGQMKPYVSTESIQISFEKVGCNNEIVPDLYVVEISVEPVASNILFSTSKNEVYIKTDGGKRKLDSLEIQQEFQRRIGWNS